MKATREKSILRSYQDGTDEVASWLVSTAEAAGFPPSAPPNEVNSTVPSSSRKGRKVKTTDEYLALARHIANTGDHQTPIPKLRHILRQVDTVIALRTRYSQRLRQSQGTADVASDERHDYFIDILRQVKDILIPCLARVQLPAGESVTLSQSQFAPLTVFTTSSSPTSSSSPSRSSSPHSRHQADAERSQDDEEASESDDEADEDESGIVLTHQFEVQDREGEAQIELQMLVDDYLALISCCTDLWTKAKAGEIHRSTAALVTLPLVGAFFEALSKTEEDIAMLNSQTDVYRMIYNSFSAATQGEFDQTALRLIQLRDTALPVLRLSRWPSDLISQDEASTSESSATDNSAGLFCIYVLAAFLTKQVDKKARIKGGLKKNPEKGEQPDKYKYDSPLRVRDLLTFAMDDFITSPPKDEPSIRFISLFSLYLKIDQIVDDTIPAARAIFEQEVRKPYDELNAQFKAYKKGSNQNYHHVSVVEGNMADIDLISSDPMFGLYTGRYGNKPGYQRHGLMARSPLMGALLASYCRAKIFEDQKRITGQSLQPLHSGLAHIYAYAREAKLIQAPWLDMEFLFFLSHSAAYLANHDAPQPPGRQGPFHKLLSMAGVPSNALRSPEHVSLSSGQRFPFPNMDPRAFVSHQMVHGHACSVGRGWAAGAVINCIFSSKWTMRNVGTQDAQQGHQVWPAFSPTGTRPNGGQRFDPPGPGDRVIRFPAGFPLVFAFQVAVQEQELAATQVPWKAISVLTKLVWESIRPRELEGETFSTTPFLELVEFLRQDEVTIQQFLSIGVEREELHMHKMALKLKEFVAAGRVTAVKGELRSRLEQNVYVQVGDEPGKIFWGIARSVF